jgi:hypothetical protein
LIICVLKNVIFEYICCLGSDIMAQAQRTPERQSEAERLVEALHDVAGRLRTMRLTPEQRIEVRNLINEMLQNMQRTVTRGQAVTQQAEQAQSRPAPRRVEVFAYDVVLNNRRYRVSLPEPLPTRRGGGLDVAAAQRRLHDLLLNNQLVTRETPEGPVLVRADVTMLGEGAQQQRFNRGPPNQRLDVFRDSYLALTFHDGRYVPSTAIRIAEAPRESGTRTF